MSPCELLKTERKRIETHKLVSINKIHVQIKNICSK